MQAVYFENRSVVFCTPDETPVISSGEKSVKASGVSAIQAISDGFINDSTVSRLYVESPDASKLFDQFCSCFREIDAAGGVVMNASGEYLMIFRRGKWDLPKGKREPGESVSDCALREVAEETGLSSLEIGSPICVTHHSYVLDGALCIKHTHWYNMLCTKPCTLVPQVEEEITEACWMDADRMKRLAATSYRSIREVISNL